MRRRITAPAIDNGRAKAVRAKAVQAKGTGRANATGWAKLAMPGPIRLPKPSARKTVGRRQPERRPGTSLTASLLRAVFGAVALLALTVCAAVIVKLTLTPSPASVGMAHTNLVPGTSIKLYLDRPSVREAALQIGGNILIGVPFGLLLPVITPRARGLLRVLLTTAVVVTLLEVAQHFFVRGRSFDVDDIILAVVGALVGYVPLGRWLSLRIHPGHRHWWQRMFTPRRA
jgi:VanZ family protein